MSNFNALVKRIVAALTVAAKKLRIKTKAIDE